MNAEATLVDASPPVTRYLRNEYEETHSVCLVVALLVGGLLRGQRHRALCRRHEVLHRCQLQRVEDGIGSKDLDGFKSDLLKTVAAGMLNGTYDKTYRAASYEAYPSPRELGKTLKLGDGFSRYENITGIYLEAGEHVVLVGNTGGKELSLLIPDWMRKPAEGIEPTKDPNGWGLHKQQIATPGGRERDSGEEGRQCRT